MLWVGQQPVKAKAVGGIDILKDELVRSGVEGREVDPIRQVSGELGSVASASHGVRNDELEFRVRQAHRRAQRGRSRRREWLRRHKFMRRQVHCSRAKPGPEKLNCAQKGSTWGCSYKNL